MINHIQYGKQLIKVFCTTDYFMNKCLHEKGNGLNKMTVKPEWTVFWKTDEYLQYFFSLKHHETSLMIKWQRSQSRFFVEECKTTKKQK